MKIRTDASDFPASVVKSSVHNSGTAVHRSPEQKIAETNIQNQKFSQAVASSLNMEKALNDALTIAHASQNVIQKAINISVRLRSIAADAITTGKIDTAALNEAMSSIKSDMKTYGEVINTPVMNSGSGRPLHSPVDLKNELNYIRNFSENYKTYADKNSNGINDIIKTLQGKSDLNKSSIDSINGRLKNVYSDIQNRNVTEPESLSASLKESIPKNPQAAIAAQGNVSRDSIEKILNT